MLSGNVGARDAFFKAMGETGVEDGPTYFLDNDSHAHWFSATDHTFVIGSDFGGFFDNYKPTLKRYDVLIDALKPDTARKVAHDNMLAMPAMRSK